MSVRPLQMYSGEMAKTPRPAKSAAHTTTNTGAMPSPLALSPAEKGITRNASRALIAVGASIKTACATITTPDALTAFWKTLATYCGRNVIALATGADSVTVKTGKTKARPEGTHGIGNKRPKAAATAA
jgi:hypothetical protein